MTLRSTPDPKDFIRASARPLPVRGLEPLALYQVDALTPLWHATEHDLSAVALPPPFWAFPWAGGQGVVRYLRDHPDAVAGRRVLDLACGSGLIAVASAMIGASSVLANDIDPICAAAVALNAELNGVAVDFVRGDLTAEVPPGIDVILAGDVFYEHPMAVAIDRFCRRARAEGLAVIVGDPGRSYCPAGLEQVGEYEISTSLEIETTTAKLTRVWKY